MKIRRLHVISMILACVIVLFTIAQSRDMENCINTVSENPLAVHTLSRIHCSFLDILSQTEQTHLEQARLRPDLRALRTQAERLLFGMCLLAALAAELPFWCVVRRIRLVFARCHAWIIAYIHWQDGEKASFYLEEQTTIFKSLSTSHAKFAYANAMCVGNAPKGRRITRERRFPNGKQYYYRCCDRFGRDRRIYSVVV